MKFAIDYRNMHTAVHGLILFNGKKTAENSLKLLNDSQDDKTFENVMEKCVSTINEVDYRKLTEVMKVDFCVCNDKHNENRTENIRIVNYGQAIDLYM